ncbi:MAG TPA: hypothetical protein VEA69_12355 [Tepidisphaeraceae bacterium]|nr:hypothetical protein [Tepidisphaeraceae bacterium]
MNLRLVTMTGADDGTDHNQLAALSAEFPFVEWGILLSYSQEGGLRFPGARWQAELCQTVDAHPGMNISLHVCGRWVREILAGDPPRALFEDRARIVAAARRIQLNTHAERHSAFTFGASGALSKAAPGKQIIFQIDGVNDDNLEAARTFGELDAVGLFDLSHGAGVLPNEWPAARPMVEVGFNPSVSVKSVLHGYAGGLGPDNLADQLPHIAAAAGDAPFWIDMETRVRSRAPGGDYFDLDKVRRCLEICRPFVS